MREKISRRRFVSFLRDGATLAVPLPLIAPRLAEGADHGRTLDGGVQPTDASEQRKIEIARGWEMLPFVKADDANPIIEPAPTKWTCPVVKSEVAWESLAAYNPAAVVRDGKVFLLYRAQDETRKTSRLGLAYSEDGVRFTRFPKPVFYPDNDRMKPYEWPGGCEDPRLIENEGGTYHLTYTTYDGKVARLAMATSKDLVTWAKHGPAFGDALGGRYRDVWSKSGAIIGRRTGDRIVAARIGGKYWMYWGDTDIFAATSDDLIRWMPVEMEGGKTLARATGRRAAMQGYQRLQSVLQPRPGKFDGDLVEPGPYAMITAHGIHLIYNSRNLDDPALPEGAYSAGQVLFDPKNPLRSVARSTEPFIRPDKEFEHKGQVGDVVFAEGLVPYKGKWFLYYGTADSRVGVAVYDPPPDRAPY